MKKENKVYFNGHKVTMEETHYVKKGSRWIETEKETKEVTQDQYNNIVNAKRFFTSIGGYERHTKSYTYIGYIVTNINSISPDKKSKSVRHFIVEK